MDSGWKARTLPRPLGDHTIAAEQLTTEGEGAAHTAHTRPSREGALPGTLVLYPGCPWPTPQTRWRACPWSPTGCRLESVLFTQGTTASPLSDLRQALRASCLEDGAKIPFPLRPVVRSHSHQSPRWEGLLWTELVFWLLCGKETVKATLPSAAQACATVTRKNLPVISVRPTLIAGKRIPSRAFHRTSRTCTLASNDKRRERRAAVRGGPGQLSSPSTKHPRRPRRLEQELRASLGCFLHLPGL